jgi:hypothetical protein
MVPENRQHRRDRLQMLRFSAPVHHARGLSGPVRPSMMRRMTPAEPENVTTSAAGSQYDPGLLAVMMSRLWKI